MNIREASSDDMAGIWSIFHQIVAAGNAYAFDRDTSIEQAEQIWLQTSAITFVAEEDGVILGSYYIRDNHAGPGSHVCNCGYMTAADARGRGLATAMCEHSQQVARQMGYKAMQFNCVVSSNTGAVRLWQKLGYEIVGTLPRAFDHAELGLVDTHIMYKWLETENE